MFNYPFYIIYEWYILGNKCIGVPWRRFSAVCESICWGRHQTRPILSLRQESCARRLALPSSSYNSSAIPVIGLTLSFWLLSNMFPVASALQWRPIEWPRTFDQQNPKQAYRQHPIQGIRTERRKGRKQESEFTTRRSANLYAESSSGHRSRYFEPNPSEYVDLTLKHSSKSILSSLFANSHVYFPTQLPRHNDGHLNEIHSCQTHTRIFLPSRIFCNGSNATTCSSMFDDSYGDSPSCYCSW